MRLLLSLAFVALGVFVPAYAGAEVKAEVVMVKKGERKLYLVSKGKAFREFSIALGGEPTGHKRQEGDKRTPEGRYVLDWKKSDSAFYKAIHISYPNAKDKEAAKERGVSPGGAIMIHGQPNGCSWCGVFMQHADWTDGCIAVKNSEMDEIWKAVDPGTPIEILP